jgi:hypothetical protein
MHCNCLNSSHFQDDEALASELLACISETPLNNTNAETSPAGRKRIEKPELMSEKTKNRRFAELDEKVADYGM